MARTEKIIVNAQPEPSTGSKADLVRDATPSDDEPLSSGRQVMSLRCGARQIAASTLSEGQPGTVR